MANSAKGGSGAGAGAIRAGAAFVSLFTDDSQLTRGLARAEQRVKAFAKAMTTAGAGIAGAGVAALGLVGKFASDVIERGSALKDMSDRTGIAADELSLLGYAADQAGSNLEGLESKYEKLQEHLADAASGSIEASKAFRDMGIDANELIGKSGTEQLVALSDALMKIANPAERLAAARKAMGKSGQELIPLLLGGGKGLREQMAKGELAGAKVTAEQAAELERMGDAINHVWLSAKYTIGSVVSVLIPTADTVENLSDSIAAIFGSVRDWANENQELVVTAVAVTAAVTAAGAAMLGLGLGISAVLTAGSAAVAVLSGLWGVVTALAPIIAVGAVIAGAAYAIYELSDSARDATDSVGAFLAGIAEGPIAYFGQMVGTFQAAWGGIRNALMSGDLALAGRIALAGLNVEFRRGVLLLTEAWANWGAKFVDQFFEAVTGVELAWNDSVAYIRTTFFDLTSYLFKQWDSLGNSIGSILERSAEIGKAAFMGWVTNTIQGFKLAAGAVGLLATAEMENGQQVAEAAQQQAEAQVKVRQDLLSKALGAGMTRDEIEAQRKADEDRILGGAALAANLRAQANAERVAEARKEFDTAIANLQTLLGMASGGAKAPAIEAAQKKLEGLPSATTGYVGTFGTGGVGKQIFGGGALTVEQKQLLVQQRILAAHLKFAQEIELSNDLLKILTGKSAGLLVIKR